MIRDTLVRIGSEYLEAAQQPLKGHKLAVFLRHGAVEAIQDSLTITGLKVEGSPGQGNWAVVPWIAIMDPVVTTTVMKGYDVVYLFSADMNTVALSFNQGTTSVREEFGRGAIDELKRRASLMKSRVPEFKQFFTSEQIGLGSKAALPTGYEAAHAFGVTYNLDDLPNEEILRDDLKNMVSLYLKLTQRGGLDNLDEGLTDDAEAPDQEIEERRLYRLHRKIDRNPRAAIKAKAIHGYICQGCGFDFEQVYGEIGKEYIEAHHLTPLADLPEDKAVALNPEKDFAVLCANCHRMIHRKNAPKDLGTFRARLIPRRGHT